MEVLASFLIIIAFLCNVHPLIENPADQIKVYPEVAGIELPLNYQVKPLSEFKNENIIKQQFDYSCGSAALATVLNYHLGENFTEQQVIQGLMNYGDAGMIEQRRAFSLLDMKRFVTVLGYSGSGFIAELDDLKELDIPGIVPIELYGYKHFVVYKGIYGGHVFFADPYMGNISFPVLEFEQMWHKNIIFLVTDGAIKTSALVLKEDDMRFVDIEMTADVLPRDIPESFITDEEKFIESQGRYLFKHLNVH